MLNIADGEVAFDVHPLDATVRTARMAGNAVLVTGGGSGRARALLKAAQGGGCIVINASVSGVRNPFRSRG